MRHQTVWAACFSPTGNTRKLVTAIARRLSEQMGAPMQTYDFTLPGAREKAPQFTYDDLVICGLPVYAGRVPNLLADFVSRLDGNGASAVPIVCYGNRSYDDALMELRNLLRDGGFSIAAAGAFVGEHSFGTQMAGGRPDVSDLTICRGFADQIFCKLQKVSDSKDLKTVFVKGSEPIRPYYRPADAEGNFIDIRKVKPNTKDICTLCKWCAKHCPMEAISFDNMKETPGICIKCNACVKGCPVGAKFFDDPRYLFHRDDLVARYALPRKEPELFY